MSEKLFSSIGYGHNYILIMVKNQEFQQKIKNEFA